MKKKVRIAAIMVLSLTLLFSVTMLLRNQAEYRDEVEIYEKAAQIAAGKSTQPGTVLPVQSETPVVSGTPVPSDAPTAPADDPAPDPLAEVDLAALQAVNADVIGWISIPGTQLSYPLVQGEDNDYYLTHAWDGTGTKAGSIFMEHQCAADFTDFNTIVYGHNMARGNMFGSLQDYRKQGHRENHPDVYIKTAEGTRRYVIFAAYEAPVQSPTYRVNVTEETDKQAVIDFALEQSVFDAEIVPQVADQVLTLSTCTGKGYEARWVVQAVKVTEGE